jgi:hypothetical protein
MMSLTDYSVTEPRRTGWIGWDPAADVELATAGCRIRRNWRDHGAAMLAGGDGSGGDLYGVQL